MPDSKPIPSQTLYAVAKGRMAAESREALIRPAANNITANLPANGASARAAWATSVMSR